MVGKVFVPSFNSFMMLIKTKERQKKLFKDANVCTQFSNRHVYYPEVYLQQPVFVNWLNSLKLRNGENRYTDIGDFVEHLANHGIREVPMEVLVRLTADLRSNLAQRMEVMTIKNSAFRPNEKAIMWITLFHAIGMHKKNNPPFGYAIVLTDQECLCCQIQPPTVVVASITYKIKPALYPSA